MYKNRMGWQRKRLWVLFSFTAALWISIDLSGAWAGTTTIGIYRPSTTKFFLRNSNTYGFGEVIVSLGFGVGFGGLPAAAKWNGYGVTTTGLFGPNTSNNYLLVSTSNTGGYLRLVAPVGAAGDLPVAGNWTGAMGVGLGLFRPSTNTFYLFTYIAYSDYIPAWGDPYFVVTVGAPGDLPVVGDWDGNGTTTIGLYRPSTNTFYLWNSNGGGPPDLVITVGAPGDLPVAGDWDGNGTTTIGLYRPSTNTFYLWNSNAIGPPDLVIPFGESNDLPVVGDWDGL